MHIRKSEARHDSATAADATKLFCSEILTSFSSADLAHLWLSDRAL